ncbi:hypothetical protein D3C76_1559590 [compost metagenome]
MVHFRPYPFGERTDFFSRGINPNNVPCLEDELLITLYHHADAHYTFDCQRLVLPF